MERPDFKTRTLLSPWTQRMEPWTDGLVLKPALLYHPELENAAWE